MNIKALTQIRNCTNLQPLDGTNQWYWCTSWTDIYEAEEAIQRGIVLDETELFLIHYPEGKVYQPLPKKQKVYMNSPIWDEGRIGIVAVDFNKAEILIYGFYPDNEEIIPLAALPLSAVTDCYALRLHREPLMLTRQGHENKFEIIWPESVSIDIGDCESFLYREQEKLYFSAWYEDPDYHEKIIVRNIHTGEILDEYPGTLYLMPNGSWWKIE